LGQQFTEMSKDILMAENTLSHKHTQTHTHTGTAFTPTDARIVCMDSRQLNSQLENAERAKWGAKTHLF